MRWLVLGMLTLAGCSPAPPDDDVDTSAPACDPNQPAPAEVPSVVVLGETSNGNYDLLVPDLLLFRHSGPQGGQHFWVRVRVYSPEERIWSFEAKLTDASGQILANGHRGFTACEASWTKEREITVFIEQPYQALSGTLTVEATSDPDVPPLTLPVSVP